MARRHQPTEAKGIPPGSFYEQNSERSLRSARSVLPIVFGLIEPCSVVDVGCGLGEWLVAARELGAASILGIDGTHVRQDLLIPLSCFSAVDVSKDFQLGSTYDLAIAVEVAEHLPPTAADGFVLTLTRAAPVVLFGAAIPGQGGHAHLNEQWLDYWDERFRTADFEMVDCIRQRIWDDPELPYHSAQNLVVFAAREYLAGNPRLAEAHNPMPTRIVHPGLWAQRQARPPALGTLIRQVPEAARNTLRARRQASERSTRP